MPRSRRVYVTVLGLHVLLSVVIVVWLILASGQAVLWSLIFLPGGVISGIRLALAFLRRLSK
jgi:hypothetical protein